MNTCYFCHTVIADTNELICITCKEKSINEAAKEALLKDQTSKDPVEILIKLFKHPNLKMHSPNHHFLLPAALLCAYYNITGNQEEKKEKILEAENRGKNILGGFCGNYGNCGAAVGAGIFYSLVYNIKPTTAGEEWKNCNLITSECLNEIANSMGPRCCKAVSFIAVFTVKNFMQQQKNFMFGNTATYSNCSFSATNPDCKKKGCTFN